MSKRRGTGVIYLGITVFFQSLQLIITAFVSFGLLSSGLPDWIASSDSKELLSLDSSHLLIASSVMLGSYVISEFVYRFEFPFAVKNKIPEMRADAIELRSDAWLELVLGFGLLLSWILNLSLRSIYESNTLDALSTFLMGFIMLGLGIYLVLIAWPEFYDSYKNLMNQAINLDKRVKLEETIKKRLPKLCNLQKPLIAYHRGSQLFITGQIQIDRNHMQSSDVIITNCENLTKTFLSETGKEIHCQFSPFFYSSEETIIEDLNQVLQSVFEVDINSPRSEAFRLLRFGKLEKSIDLIKSNNHSTKDEELLAIFVLSCQVSQGCLRNLV